MKIYQHNVFDPWPLEDESIQAIITSPPYWQARKYSIPDIIIGGTKDCDHDFEIKFYPDKRGILGSGLNGRDPYKKGEARISHKSGFCHKCKAWKGQYGLEPNYQDFIVHTLLWVKEAYRVLKNDGIFFLNLGDSYNSKPSNGDKEYSKLNNKEGLKGLSPRKKQTHAAKCKLLIPQRIAIALIDQGWILRNDIVWYKKNSMPESMTDRFSKRFEYIFMFTKKQKYYFDLDAVRERYKDPEDLKRRISKENKYNRKYESDQMAKRLWMNSEHKLEFNVERGGNPGDLWEINNQPSPFKHYAMWPTKLIQRMILCSSKKDDNVLDPFCGSGTTLKVAEELNRVGLGFDLGYQDIQKKRLSNIQKTMF